MKRGARFALVTACFGTLIGCTRPATETTLSQVAVPEALPAAKAAEQLAGSSETDKPAPQRHEVRKEVAAEVGETDATAAPGIPKVFLTAEHSAMCRVRTGDRLPAISLPQLSGGDTEISKLQGKQATIAVFWGKDPWMSETALSDLAAIGLSSDVAIVGIAVELTNKEAESAIEKAGVKFPILLDADGKAFNQVGMTKMPRIYVLDEAGEIVWFDIEYSQSTQRELKQTLDVLAGH